MLQPMVTCGLETFGLHKLNYCNFLNTIASRE